MNSYILVVQFVSSDHVISDSFHFMVNWFGHDFDGVDLEFNCPVVIDYVIRGNYAEAEHIPFNIKGQNTQSMTLGFLPAIVGAGGITIYVKFESEILPLVTKVTLYQPNHEGKFPYSESQIQQINDSIWPQP